MARQYSWTCTSLEKGQAKYDYGPLYYNVNTELHAYTPIAFDDLVADFQQKKLLHYVTLEE